MKNNILDTSAELLITPYHGGIKLTHPSKYLEQQKRFCISEIFNSPLNIYFLNQESIIQNLNENTINTCMYPSLKDTIGKTVRIAAKKEVADMLIQHDRAVLKNARLIIEEENFIRSRDEVSVPALSFKFPWYGSDNKIIGIFGCSIVIEKSAITGLSECLSLLMNTGLLLSSPQNKTIVPGKIFDEVYLSKREADCLNLLIHGKTSKMIAKILNLSYRTVEHYLDNIKIKFNVNSRSELIDKAIELFI